MSDECRCPQCVRPEGKGDRVRISVRMDSGYQAVDVTSVYTALCLFWQIGPCRVRVVRE